MERFQLRLQKIILVFILVGSALATLAGRDRWYPFSNYPMYASVFPPTPFVSHYLRIIHADGNETPFAVRPWLWPYWHIAFSEALLATDDDAVIERKLRATLAWYNQELKDKTRGEMKPALALRLYRDETSWSRLVETSIASGTDFENLDHPDAKLRLEVKR